MCSRSISLLAFVICFSTLRGQSNTEALILKLDSIMQVGMDSMAFPGAQILVRYKDSIYLHKCWGYHTYASNREVNRRDVYDLASVTKVSSGLPLLMKLYGEQKIDIDLPIGTYISALKHSNKKDLTLRQILAHQARLQPYIVFWQHTLKKNGKYKCRTYDSNRSDKYPIQITDKLYLHKRYKGVMTKAIKKSRLKDDVAYLYSGLIFILMPDMIENIVRQPFEDYLYKTIFNPISAFSLRYNPLRFTPLDSIVPTEYDSLWRKKLVHGMVHDEAAAMLGGVSCNAGLFGNAEDLSSLFQLYLNKGSWQGKQLISDQAVEIFTDYQYIDNRRGLGFDKPMREYDPERSYISRYASKKSFGHSGFTGTFVWADPQYDLVVVFLSNRVYPSRDHRKLYTMGLRPAFHDAIYQWVINMRSPCD